MNLDEIRARFGPQNAEPPAPDPVLVETPPKPLPKWPPKHIVVPIDADRLAYRPEDGMESAARMLANAFVACSFPVGTEVKSLNVDQDIFRDERTIVVELYVPPVVSSFGTPAWHLIYEGRFGWRSNRVDFDLVRTECEAR